MKMLLMAASILIAGCSSQQMKQYEMQTAFDTLDAECKARYAAKDLDPIRDKVPALKQARPTLTMLSDGSYVTDAERPLILALDAAAIACSNQRQQHIAKYYGSDYAAVDGAASSDAQRNRLALYQGTITWGQYVTKAQEIADQARGMFASLDERRRGTAIQQQAANAQSAGAAAALMQATRPTFQPLQPITPQPRPINCTSQRMGAYTNTTCQ